LKEKGKIKKKIRMEMFRTRDVKEQKRESRMGNSIKEEFANEVAAVINELT